MAGRWPVGPRRGAFDILRHRKCREIFGLNSPGWPHAANTSYVGVGDPWYTSLFSLLAEYRWEPSDDWTFFLGGREDIHTYTDWLFSPRSVDHLHARRSQHV